MLHSVPYFSSGLFCPPRVCAPVSCAWFCKIFVRLDGLMWASGHCLAFNSVPKTSIFHIWQFCDFDPICTSQLHHIRKYESWIQMLMQNIIHWCHQPCDTEVFLDGSISFVVEHLREEEGNWTSILYSYGGEIEPLLLYSIQWIQHRLGLMKQSSTSLR